MTKETVEIKIPKDCIPPNCKNKTDIIKKAIEHYDKNYC